MTLIALWDTETNGLLRSPEGKSLATRMHCVGAKIGDQWWAGMDSFPGRECDKAHHASLHGMAMDIDLPDGSIIKNVRIAPIQVVLRELEKADLRVAHNGQDFDERVTRKLYPWWNPKGQVLDTLILWKLLYPQIYRDGPNTHKTPGQLKVRYSLEAIGYRLGAKKDKGFDPGDWQTFSWDMLLYMMQDVVVLERAFKWAMSRKPDQRAVEIEHGFAGLMRRQEAWGFTVDYPAMLSLQALVQKTLATLETELIETYGEWWAPGTVVYPKASRAVKLEGYADVTTPRWGVKGNALKPYVGPPKCHYEKGAPFTPIERVQFSPGSRDHVRLMLQKRHGWVPKKFTDKGQVAVDDEVLRSLDYPEAPKLADYYAAQKVNGYVSVGKQAWISCAVCGERGEWRVHGSVNTIGTYTFRCGHMKPNMGQIPTRDPIYGPLCRRIFTARPGFKLVGWDGSGVQLRGLAHYLAKGGRWASGTRWGDNGTYAGVFERDEDPHLFMAETIGRDLMGVILEDGKDMGRINGKTMNYALCFGGGDERLGSICRPHGTQQMKRDIGKEVKERMLPVFGTAFDDLKAALKDRVEETRTLTGLDGTIARVGKPHAALATLLQMFEGKVMKKGLILHNDELLRRGFRPGVDQAGQVDARLADWEYCANVHDEAQADVRPERVAEYVVVSQWALPEAGRQLNVRCPLKADVKVGETWDDTH